MKYIELGNSGLQCSQVAFGGASLAKRSAGECVRIFETAIEQGINTFDNADIYGGGEAETRFGEVWRKSGIVRESVVFQSKCAIRLGKASTFYDSSYEHIIASVHNSLRKMQTDYLDTLLLHRPDALMEPEVIAEAFDRLEKEGKVRYFGVSNHNAMQMALLQKYIRQKLIVNQMQFSLVHTGLINVGMEVNTILPGGADHDGLLLDYCRLQGISIQAWSPFRDRTFTAYIDNPDYETLNIALRSLANETGMTPTGIAAAWMMRHPAKIQLVIGTGNAERIKAIAQATAFDMTREAWYAIYQAAGNKIL